MHKAGDVSEDLPVCQPVCHPALSSPPLNHTHTKKNKKKTQACMSSHTHDDDVYEHSCARINQSSQSVFVAPLLRTDGNLRHNAGGLSFEAPFPLPVITPPRLVLHQHLPPFFPLPVCAHQAEIKLQSHRGRPQNLAAGSGSLPLLLRGDKSRPVFDTITQTERGRKRRCNIHMKITRLAAT